MIMVIKWGRRSLAGRVARMKEMRDEWRVLLGNHGEKIYFQGRMHSWEDNV
jgi:hypothetical protein